MKKVVAVSFFLMMQAAGLDVYPDPIAKKSGELAAELTFEAWVLFVEEKKEALANIVNKLKWLAADYAVELNPSFLNGYKTGLEDKDVLTHFSHRELNLFQKALILSAHRYFTLQLTKAITTQNFSLDYDEESQKKALEGAVITVYGEIKPEIMQELKMILAQDRISLNQ